jgi:hypothetical protein
MDSEDELMIQDLMVEDAIVIADKDEKLRIVSYLLHLQVELNTFPNICEYNPISLC